jgi:hypothetical protein
MENLNTMSTAALLISVGSVILTLLHLMSFLELLAISSQGRSEAELKATLMMNERRLVERFRSMQIRESISKLVGIFKDELKHEIEEGWNEAYNVSTLLGLLNLMLTLICFFAYHFWAMLFPFMVSGLMMVVCKWKYGLNPEEGNP